MKYSATTESPSPTGVDADVDASRSFFVPVQHQQSTPQTTTATTAVTTTITTPMMSISKKDSHLIDLDVARGTWEHLDGAGAPGCSSTPNSSTRDNTADGVIQRQKRLARVIRTSLLHPPPPDSRQRCHSYYQGYHLVAAVVVSTLGDGGDGDNAAIAMLRRLAHTHLLDFLRCDGFDALQTTLRCTILPILCYVDPELHDVVLHTDETIPLRCLPWILTWFSHCAGTARHPGDMIQFGQVTRFFDACLASHPLFVVYAAIAHIRHHRDQYLASVTDGDNDVDSSRTMLDAQALIDDALDLMARIPPSRVVLLASRYYQHHNKNGHHHVQEWLDAASPSMLQQHHNQADMRMANAWVLWHRPNLAVIAAGWADGDHVVVRRRRRVRRLATATAGIALALMLLAAVFSGSSSNKKDLKGKEHGVVSDFLAVCPSGGANDALQQTANDAITDLTSSTHDQERNYANNSENSPKVSKTLPLPTPIDLEVVLYPELLKYALDYALPLSPREDSRSVLQNLKVAPKDKPSSFPPAASPPKPVYLDFVLHPEPVQSPGPPTAVPDARGKEMTIVISPLQRKFVEDKIGAEVRQIFGENPPSPRIQYKFPY
jgi:hypothetical protein